MTILDQIANDKRFQPFWGWHDDHRYLDRTAAYTPAIQQNRSEFHQLADILGYKGLRGKCLQLGLGIPGASHIAFQMIFDRVWTIDSSLPAVKYFLNHVSDEVCVVVGDTHDDTTFDEIVAYGAVDLDFLFIDAGHLLEDVSSDFYTYGKLVKSGGVIAIHDALKRPTYEEEIQVWKFVDELRSMGRSVQVIGDEIGIAWTTV